MAPRTDSRTKWNEVRQAVVEKTDIRAAFERHCGLRVPKGAVEKSDGRLECHSLSREDNNVSGFINVRTGVYSDSGSDDPKNSLSFFDVMVKHGGFADFKTVLAHFAEAAGVELPTRDRGEAIDLFEECCALVSMNCRRLRMRYRLSLLSDLQAAGSRIGWYGIEPWRICVVAIPFFDPTLISETQRGWVIQPADGSDLRHGGTDEKPKIHKRISVGSPSGFVNIQALRAIKEKRAEIVIKTEGISDWMALMWLCPDEIKASGQIAITSNSSGATEAARPKEFASSLTGLKFVVIHDADKPGQAGAQKWIDAAQGSATSIKNVQLPYEIAEKHGKDLRNWIGEQLAGRSKTQVWQMLMEMIGASPELAKPIDQLPEGIFPISHPMGRTEIQNGKRLVAKYGDRLLYCEEWQAPLVWDGRLWKAKKKTAALALAKDVAGDIWKQVSNAKEGEEKDVVGFAERTSTLRGVTAMMHLAYSEPGITIEPDSLDQNHWLLNCQNGTINLRTGELQEFDPSNRITKICPTEYHPDAESADWLECLRSIIPDDDMIIHLQRLCGYSLTGDVSEQVMPIFWGDGSNGKSTICGAILDTIGEHYAIKADSRMLTEQPAGGHPTEIMDLFGRRFVIASETKEGESLAESVVKSLTGGDRIRGRRMREDSWEYKPTHKIFMCTNHRPKVMGTDEGIWRRLRLFPFTETFWEPDDVRRPKGGKIKDPGLPARLAAARSAILAWMVRGCLDWQEHGLATPNSVLVASSEYRSDQNSIAAFVNERCRLVAASRETSKDLYNQFKDWAHENGEQVLSQKAFSGRLQKSFNLTHEKSNIVWIRGIMIEPAWKDQVANGKRRSSRDDDGARDESDNVF